MSILDFGKPGIGKSHNPALGFALLGLARLQPRIFRSSPMISTAGYRDSHSATFCGEMGYSVPSFRGMVITAGGKSSAWLRPGAASAPGKILLSTVSPLGDTVESMLLLLLLLL